MDFYRMNGLGNNFVIYDIRKNNESEADLNNLIKAHNLEAHDYDQKIIIKNSDNFDAEIEILNIDNSHSSACGNATRCVARILYETNNIEESSIKTDNRVLYTRRITDSSFEVNMGKALTNWQDIPLSHELNTESIDILDKNNFGTGFALNIGNPHIVFFVDDVEKIDLKSEVSHLETNDLFPENININIATINSESEITLRTWERGAGQTMACGTGACATAFAGYSLNKASNRVKINMLGGVLDITINSENNILMAGETELEYKNSY